MYEVLFPMPTETQHSPLHCLVLVMRKFGVSVFARVNAVSGSGVLPQAPGESDLELSLPAPFLITHFQALSSIPSLRLSSSL